MSDSIPPTDPVTPGDPQQPLAQDPAGPLMDWALGQAEDDNGHALNDALAADAALAAEAAGWQRLVEAERSVWADELAVARTQAPRIAAQVRFRAARVRDGVPASATGSSDIAAPRSRRTARVLAISIGVHAAALALLALFVARGGTEDQRDQVDMAARFAESDDAGLPDQQSALAELFQDAARSGPIHVPDAVLLAGAVADGDEGDAWVESLEDLAQGHETGPTALEHPRDVAIPMWIRRNETLKARRLSLLGFEADGTLRAVRRGLRWLSLRQHQDGSFPAPDGTSRLTQTAIALLPFLGDGFDASRAVRGPNAREIGVVRRGVAWIRTQAFTKEGYPDPALDAEALGAVAMALSEDYMLGYGRLRIQQAQTRANEINRLAEALRAVAAAVEVPSGIQADVPWALWGLDATVRTGLVPAQSAEEARFQAWVASAGDAEGDALAMGTAVLLGDGSADKAAFRAWSQARSGGLLETLLPNGRSRSDSDDVRAVGETARRLLALQIAYRTY